MRAGSGIEEIDELFSPDRYPIEEALGAHGIAMADVTALANCHLHVDHAGQNRLFAGRPIFAQRLEWTMVHEPDYTIPEWVDRLGLSYELLDGEAEVAPGLRLLPTPGHSPGHQSLVADTSAGTVVVAGQAVLTRAEWTGIVDAEHSGEPTEDGDRRESYLASVTRLRVLEPNPRPLRARPEDLESRRVIENRAPFRWRNRLRRHRGLTDSGRCRGGRGSRRRGRPGSGWR